MNKNTGGSGRDLAGAMRAYLPVAVLVILVVASSFLSKNFLTLQNIFNLLRQNSAVAIVSLGMLLVILTGGIDLSVGSLAAFSSVLFTTLIDSRQPDPMPVPLALALTFAGAIAFGALSGYLVAFQKMAPFVVTLAAMTAARGVAYMISHAKTIPIGNDFVNTINKGSLVFADGLPGVPYSVILAFGIFLLFAFVITIRTRCSKINSPDKKRQAP